MHSEFMWLLLVKLAFSGKYILPFDCSDSIFQLFSFPSACSNFLLCDFCRSHPFYSEDVKTMYTNILEQDLSFVNTGLPPDAQDLISGLLQRDPDKRVVVGEKVLRKWVLMIPSSMA